MGSTLVHALDAAAGAIRPPARRLALALACMLAAAYATAQPNPYTAVAGWPVLGGQRALGSVSGVYPGPNGAIWIAERCGANDCSAAPDLAPIIAFDAVTGRPLASTGAGLFVWPHGIYVDRDGNLWITDGRGDGMHGHQVFKLSPDGRVLMRLGEAGVPGNGPDRLNGPTGVVVAPDGTVFVADGHETESNHRIVKYSPTGRFLAEWGRFGSGPGEFNVPHAIAMDSRGRIFVADRDNNRIQIFDQDGRFLDEWTQFGRPSGIYIDANDTLYVSDNQSNDARNPGWRRGIRVGSARDGVVRAFIPDPDFDPAVSEETSAHGIAADADGNIYGAEVWSKTVRKYVR